MSELARAWEAAEKAWRKAKERNAVAKRQCESCFRKWKATGRKEEERPPLFPADYEGKCPTCGSELSRPIVPF